jgi:hypothetical protein
MSTPATEAKPAGQPCSTCSTCTHFRSRGRKTGEMWGYCSYIEDTVKSYWTGCKVHKPTLASQQPPTT